MADNPSAKSIIHFGIGNFFRAHQAVYTQEANEFGKTPWWYEGIAMHSPVLCDELNAGDGQYDLVVRHPDGPQLQKITVLKKAWHLPSEPALIMERIADPQVRIITITVTEKGYCADLGARRLDLTHADIRHDLNNQASPKTLPGAIVAGLHQRWKSRSNGLTLISCDNIPDNGALLKNVILEFAGKIDTGLADWIRDACTFPSSMVDRITPATTNTTREVAARLGGSKVSAPVETEPFSQWVLEDDFADERPDWERAGVLFVDTVKPFETMKLRMLNGAHSLIAYLGMISGHDCVKDVMAVPAFNRLVRQLMDEAAATLQPNSAIDFGNYADQLVKRFTNTAIHHRCEQIAMDGSQKLPQRIFSPALDAITAGRNADIFALTTSLWLHHIERASKEPGDLELSDPLAKELKLIARTSKGEADQFVTRIGEIPAFKAGGLFQKIYWLKRVSSYLTKIQQSGLPALVEHFAAKR